MAEFYRRRERFRHAFLAEPVGAKMQAIAITANITLPTAWRVGYEEQLESVITTPAERQMLAEYRRGLKGLVPPPASAHG